MIQHLGHVQPVLLLKGLPGSGKSTFAKEILAAGIPCHRLISRDDLRFMLLGKTLPIEAVDVDGDRPSGKWTPRKEQQVVQARDALLRRFLQEGCCVIVDETLLNPKMETHLRGIISEFPGVIVDLKDFTDVDVDVCVERDIHRGSRAVGAGVIRRMAKQLLRDPAPLHLAGKPDAIICDIDGTLALFPETENPFNRDFLEVDVVNAPVLRILQRFSTANVHIILTSGRGMEHHLATLQWLKKNLVPFDVLLMRNLGDRRKDSIIKRELYEVNVKGLYNVLFVLDDRDQVVDMWRRLGLTCLQVEYGAF